MYVIQIILLLCLWIAVFPAAGQTVVFYNVENFFDAANDPASDDGDFTPEGMYRWTPERFREKTGHIAQVLSAIGADFAGLAEVENHSVLDSLTALLPGYRYTHFDSPDPRGIDVALLYRPAAFRPASAQAVRYRELPRYPTREILHVSGAWRGHPTHVLVCHLPSVVSSRSVRLASAESVRHYADSLIAADPDHLVLVLGDFNANPGDRPMAILTRGGLENPFRALYRQGYGTYHYRGRWNMYDSVLVGGALPGTPQAAVFVRDYLIQPDGPYKGYPYRSFSGTEYIGGYSDHLPVMISFK